MILDSTPSACRHLFHLLNALRALPLFPLPKGLVCLFFLGGICYGASIRLCFCAEEISRDPSIILIKDAAPLLTIYVSPEEWKNSSDLKLAVSELNDHLQKISGTRLQIRETNAGKDIEGPSLIIGELAKTTDFPPLAPKNSSGGGFRLVVSERGIVIAGDTAIGSLFGVYELLERLGCAWIMPGETGEIIPSATTVRLPYLDITQSPAFVFSTIIYSKGSNEMPEEDRLKLEIWERRNRILPESYARQNSPYIQVQIGGHVWQAIIKKYKKEFDADPAMFALVRQPDGSLVRKGPQLEVANPKVIDLVTRYIRDLFEENHWPKDKLVCIGIGPADGGGFSESPESLAIGGGRVDPTSGTLDRTDEVLYLANHVLEKLQDEYPNLYLGQYLYGYHGNTPWLQNPPPHFVNVAADIGFSRYHSTGDEKSPSRSFYKSVLEKWDEFAKKQGNPFYFRGYGWNLGEGTFPYTKVRIWGEDIPYYYEKGYIGLFTWSWAESAVIGTSDYIYTRLAWDPTRSWKEELSRYCRLAFGEKAGEIMEDINLQQIERQHSAGQEAGGTYALPLIYNDVFVRKILALFTKAEEIAATPQQKFLIHSQRYPWEQMMRLLAMRKAEQAFDYTAAKREFDGIVADYYRMRESNVFLINSASLKMLDRRLRPTIEEGVKYSTGDYHIIYEVPERLPCRFDPHNTGEQMQLFAADRNSNQLTQIATSTSTWDAQGLPWATTGTVWYYFDFPGSNIPEGKGVGLFLGSPDNQSSVWVNEKPAGTRTGFGRAHIFDITDLVNLKETNRVVVAVRKLNRNELGTGGLMSPSFVFSGPRVQITEEKPKDRALEGGEVEKEK